MKNLKLVAFLVVGMILLLTFQSQAQEIVQTTAPGLFSQIGDWFKANAIQAGILVLSTILTHFGITKLIKAAAQKGAVFFTQLSHTTGDIATLCNAVDKSIKNDDTIDQNSIKEVIESGKQVIVEMKDMKAVFTPTKV